MEKIPRPVKTYHTESYDRLSQHHSFSGAAKTILITGGASGIGRAITLAFAAAGASHIIVVSRSSAPQAALRDELSTAYPSLRLTLHQASITDAEATAQILHDVGPVDVLVLNAAVAHPRLRATEVTPEQVREAFDVNTQSVFVWTQAYLAAPGPAEGGRKTVINVSSGAVHIPGAPRVAYGASKAAAVLLLQSFGAQVENAKVRIVSFHPVSLYTPGDAANIPKDMMKWDDIRLPADFAVWLAGEESGFLHGKFVWANWDVEELVALRERCEKDPSFLTLGLLL